MASAFDEKPILKFLGLPEDYQPSASIQPLEFLKQHLQILPPHLLLKFSIITSAKERTALPVIRNRRLRYIQSAPPEFTFVHARNSWPTLWEGRERRGVEEGKEERQWVKDCFLRGSAKHVGKLGDLLSGYEEDREAERVRTLRREVVANDLIPEEDSDDEEVCQAVGSLMDFETDEASRLLFERRVSEKFIYGLLEFDYDRVDFDEFLDTENDRDTEERWFEEDDESSVAN